MLILNTASLPNYGLDRVFSFAKESGIEGIEINVNKDLDTQNPEYLKKLEIRHNLPIKAFCMAESCEESHFKAFQLTVKHFPKVKINLNSPQNLSYGYKQWMNSIVPRLAEKYDLIFCRKNAPFRSILGIFPVRSENSLFTLAQAGDVCIDISALGTSQEDIIRGLNVVGGKLQHVYLSNFYKETPYGLPMEGSLPVESFLSKLKKQRWAGDFSLKVNRLRLSEGDDLMVVKKLKACTEFYQKFFLSKENEVLAPIQAGPINAPIYNAEPVAKIITTEAPSPQISQENFVQKTEINPNKEIPKINIPVENNTVEKENLNITNQNPAEPNIENIQNNTIKEAIITSPATGPKVENIQNNITKEVVAPLPEKEPVITEIKQTTEPLQEVKKDIQNSEAIKTENIIPKNTENQEIVNTTAPATEPPAQVIKEEQTTNTTQTQAVQNNIFANNKNIMNSVIKPLAAAKSLSI